MTDSLHLNDEIQDLLDGRLEQADLKRVQAHLASCSECSARRDEIAAVRTASSRALRAGEAPDQLIAEISAALEHEVAAVRRRWVWAAAAAAALVAALGLALLLRRPDLPDRAAKDFAGISSGTLVLELRTDEARLLERFFEERRIPFRTRVLDLGMMQYRLVGGRAQTIAGRPSALFVYRGPGGRLLVCEMYRGQLAELPHDARRFEHGGIEFRAYRRKGSTQVFWQEGDITCVLVSEAPIEEVLPLAFAKAMKA